MHERQCPTALHDGYLGTCLFHTRFAITRVSCQDPKVGERRFVGLSEPRVRTQDQGVRARVQTRIDLPQIWPAFSERVTFQAPADPSGPKRSGVRGRGPDMFGSNPTGTRHLQVSALQGFGERHENHRTRLLNFEGLQR